jgi:ribosomal protein S18 acetylase RimI-like enzyme
MILVPEEYQGHGIGHKIMQSIIGDAISHGQSITLDVIKANPVTGFYEKLGFQRVGNANGVYSYKLEPHR